MPLLAKTEHMFGHLKSQFHDHHVRKEYRAFVYGHMKEKWGTINRLIGRNAKDHRLRSAERGAYGTLRSAVTNWELIAQSATHAYLKISKDGENTPNSYTSRQSEGQLCDTRLRT